jgi:hypothetical protein
MAAMEIDTAVERNRAVLKQETQFNTVQTVETHIHSHENNCTEGRLTVHSAVD